MRPDNKMKKVIKSMTLAAMCFVVVACSDQAITEEKILRPVQYQKVVYSDGESTRVISGTSVSDLVNKLSFRSNGILSELNMKLGQNVTKGQLLAKLDNIQAQLNYENSISARNSSESNLKTSKLNLDRVRALYEKGGSALSDFEAAKDAYRTAQQNYNSSVRNVDIQKEQINYGYLYASADGEVASLNVELNENISAGQVIATINAGTTMDIALGVPEGVINQIKSNMEVEVGFASLGNNKFSGVVKEISPSIDSNTSTYPVVINVISPSTNIKPGMAANVTFHFEKSQADESPRLIVPANAVGEGSMGRFVFLLQPSGKTATVKKQAVTIGELTVDGFEIVAGLKNGQFIATAGLQTLLDGQEVLFKQKKAL
jgi:RND family efflux transporter MFP subunit